MKKIYLWSLLAIFILGILGYTLGFMDNGPKKIKIEEIPSRFEE